MLWLKQFESAANTAYAVMQTADIKNLTHNFASLAFKQYSIEKAKNYQDYHVRHDSFCDLRETSGFIAMVNHLATHATTGLVETGSSTSTAVPYHDLQGYTLSAVHLDPSGMLHQKTSAELVNILRAFITHIGEEYVEAVTRSAILSHSISRGRTTFRNPEDKKEQSHLFYIENADYMQHALEDKFKYIICIADTWNSYPDRQLSYQIMQEMSASINQNLEAARNTVKEDMQQVHEILATTNTPNQDIWPTFEHLDIFTQRRVDLNLLTVDTAHDWDLIAGTTRYDISSHSQLQHLIGVDATTEGKLNPISKEECPIIDSSLWQESLLRDSGEKSLLPSPQFLDWRFNQEYSMA